MRFLCDAMLGGLARWLRAAGYDSVLAEGGWDDRALVALCAGEDQLLLTKDRELALNAGASVPLLRLAGRSIDDNARELSEALGIDWQYAPFTRCLIDNAVLAPAEPGGAERVPPRSRNVGGPLRSCPRCGRLYWQGGHVRRMQLRLAAWQSHRTAAG